MEMAEAVRFELTKSCPLPVFKTGAFNHSATPPHCGVIAHPAVRGKVAGPQA